MKTVILFLFISIPALAQIGPGGGGGGTIPSTTSALKGDGAGNAAAVTGSGSNCVHVDGTSASCSGTSGASAALDNLSAVSINTSLLAQTGVDAGSTTKPFRELFLWGSGTFGTTYIRQTGTPTGARVWTWPDVTDTVVGLAATQTLSSKTFVDPVLGAATATSINKMAITAPASSSTLAVADGKTFTVSNTMTMAGTDGQTYTFPSTSATMARTDAGQTFTGTQTMTVAAASSSTGTTQSADDNSTKLATTAYVDRMKTRAISFSVGDPNGSALSTGVTYTDYLTVPFGCTISAYNLAVDAGTITVKFLKVATGTAIPTVGSNSISTSGVSIASGTAIHSTTLTDFTTTTVTANDIMGMQVTAASTAKFVNGVLQCDQ